MRQSVVDLAPSRTASQVDLASEDLEDILLPKEPLTQALPNTHLHRSRSESAVTDMEDSMVDETSTKQRLKKLDKTRGFMKYKPLGEAYRPPRKPVKDWKELSNRLTVRELKYQSARCMDCGVTFCQSNSGCPIPNVILKWNDLVFKALWRGALSKWLLLTNNFPELAGRV